MSVSKMLGSMVQAGQCPGQSADEVVDHDRVEAEVRGQRLAGVAGASSGKPLTRAISARSDASTTSASIAAAGLRAPTARSARRRRPTAARRRLAASAARTAACSRNRAIDLIHGRVLRPGRRRRLARAERGSAGGRSTAAVGRDERCVGARLHPRSVLSRELVAAPAAGGPAARARTARPTRGPDPRGRGRRRPRRSSRPVAPGPGQGTRTGGGFSAPIRATSGARIRRGPTSIRCVGSDSSAATSGVGEPHGRDDLLDPVVGVHRLIDVEQPAAHGRVDRRSGRDGSASSSRHGAKASSGRLHQRRVEGVRHGRAVSWSRPARAGVRRALARAPHPRPDSTTSRGPLTAASATVGSPSMTLGDLGHGGAHREHRAAGGQRLHQPPARDDQPARVVEVEDAGVTPRPRTRRRCGRSATPGSMPISASDPGERVLHGEDRRLGELRALDLVVLARRAARGPTGRGAAPSPRRRRRARCGRPRSARTARATCPGTGSPAR